MHLQQGNFSRFSLLFQSYLWAAVVNYLQLACARAIVSSMAEPIPFERQEIPVVTEAPDSLAGFLDIREHTREVGYGGTPAFLVQRAGDTPAEAIQHLRLPLQGASFVLGSLEGRPEKQRTFHRSASASRGGPTALLLNLYYSDGRGTFTAFEPTNAFNEASDGTCIPDDFQHNFDRGLVDPAVARPLCHVANFAAGSLLVQRGPGRAPLIQRYAAGPGAQIVRVGIAHRM
jgi:hypothetical protein